MSSISNHQQDRLSNLPPHVISHILSFLPTEIAVRTSVLSTYWYQQWISITRLYLADHLPAVHGRKCALMNSSRFVSIVNYVLRLLTVTRLDVFRLSCKQPYDVAHIYTWVWEALSRFSVRRIELILVPYAVLELHLLLPCSLLSCSTLEVLVLGCGFSLNVPTSTSLVGLKILHLDFVSFSDDESFSRLISSCPVLEELNLQGCMGTGLRRINISSPSLQRLFIWSGLFLYEVCRHSILLNTPSLRYLDYGDNCIPRRYSVEKLPCLEWARIYMKPNEPLIPYADSNDPVFKPISDLAVGISNVRFLSLSKGSLEALGHSLYNLPMFPRLINLKIEVLTIVGWRVLTAFLESSPQLATLIFGAVGGDSFSWSEHIEGIYATQASLPHSILFNLKVIEVKDFLGNEVELEILRYFLEQAKFLSRLVISPSTNLGLFKEYKAGVIDKVLKFPKFSESCEVVIVGD